MTAYTQILKASSIISKQFTYPGVRAGTSLFYSNGAIPEGWTEETAKLKLSITDTIAGRARLLEAHISKGFLHVFHLLIIE
ncbi:MAG: hypothetical protein WCJ61_11865 [Paludibacter sp.]